MPSLSTRVYVRLQRMHPVRLVLVGYASYTLLAWFLLSLPICWEPGQRISSMDSLFLAASAVSTTGLISVNTPLAFSFLGELVILLSIQISGLGYMTFGSFVVLAGSKRLTEIRKGVTRTEFSLPDGFSTRHFVRNVVLFTFLVEAIGAVLLYPTFLRADVITRAAEESIAPSFTGHLHVAWQSLFHSVSAFCTAGFSLFPDSLERYAGNFWVSAIISVLCILGAVGFIVMTDAFRSATRASHRICLTTKIILLFTFASILVGTALLFVADEVLAELPAERRMLVAFFQATSAASTAGFNSYPIGMLGTASVLLMLVLVIIGASPSGTGGGIKSTTITAMIATALSTLRGQTEITFFKKKLPGHRVTTAFAVLTMYTLTLLLGSYLLLLSETRSEAVGSEVWPFEDLVFEAASALGTVGLSRGVTPDLTNFGKLIVIGLMFAGRVGPLTLGLALFTQKADSESMVPSCDSKQAPPATEPPSKNLADSNSSNQTPPGAGSSRSSSDDSSGSEQEDLAV